MYASIISDIKRAFHSNMMGKLITINVGVFLLMGIFWLAGRITHSAQLDYAYQEIMAQLSISESFMTNLKKPWTYLSYMFVHRDIFHLLWNMIMLGWFGRIIGDLLGDNRILPVYLMGGFFGAVFMMLVSAITGIPELQNVLMVGASAAIMAFALAAATLVPDYSFRLLFIGEVKLKYIVLVLIILDLARIANAENTGGYLSHIGGAIFGWFFVFMLRRGVDITLPFQNLMDKIQKPMQSFDYPSKPTVKMRVLQGHEKKNFPFQSSTPKPEILSDEERLDIILEKIKLKGYNNLETDDKEFLHQVSNKK